MRIEVEFVSTTMAIKYNGVGYRFIVNNKECKLYKMLDGEEIYCAKVDKVELENLSPGIMAMVRLIEKSI